MDRGYNLCSTEGRVRLLGGGPRCLLPQGGGVVRRLPRFGTPDRERREIHRTLLQSMPFAFSARLPPTGRVRRRIRTATRRGEFGGLDTNLCPRPIVSEFSGACQCANKTVSLGGSPRTSQAAVSELCQNPILLNHWG